MSVESTEAAAALAAMRESRERLAAAANCPLERHLAFAALMGGLVASPAAPPIPQIVIELLLLVGVALLVRWDKRRTGMFINGYRAGRTLWLTLGILLFSLAAFAIGNWMRDGYGLVWVPLALGPSVAAVAFVASLAWKRIYLKELRETP